MGWAEYSLAFAIFSLSHSVPVRPPVWPRLVVQLAQRGFTLAYSALSLAVLAWLIGAAGRAPYVPPLALVGAYTNTFRPYTMRHVHANEDGLGRRLDLHSHLPLPKVPPRPARSRRDLQTNAHWSFADNEIGSRMPAPGAPWIEALGVAPEREEEGGTLFAR